MTHPEGGADAPTPGRGARPRSGGPADATTSPRAASHPGGAGDGVSHPFAGALDPAAAAELWRAAGGVGRVAVRGGSMRPLLRDGDVVRVRAGAEPRIGDVVVARTREGLVVHRVIARDATGVVLRGDDAPAADPARPLEAVLGRVTAVEGAPERRLDGPAARAAGRLAAGLGRAQRALGGRPRRPRPGIVLRAARAVERRVLPDAAPEERLVLLLARVEPGEAALGAARRLAAGGLRWERVAALAERGEVGPLVHRGLQRLELPAAWPADVGAALQRAAVGNALRAEALDALVGDYLDRLAAAGIPVLVHKGAALAHIVYPEPGLRVCGDVDLSVPEAALRRAGPLDWEGIWQRAETAKVAGRDVLVPAPTDLLLTVVANAVRRGGSPARDLVDVAEIVRRLGPRIDWPAFGEALARSRLDRRAWLPLSLAAGWLEAPIPPRHLEPPEDLSMAGYERWLLAAKMRRPLLRLPTTRS